MRAFRMSLMCAALLIGGGASALAQSDSADGMSKATEQCIRDNAPAVEQTFTNLNEGVTFLVTNLCGAPIAADQERQRQERTAAAEEQARAQCEANRAQNNANNTVPNGVQPADPCTKLPNANAFANLLSPYMGLMQDAAAAQIRFYGGKSAVPTSLAAKLLLELRLKHSQQGTH